MSKLVGRLRAVSAILLPGAVAAAIVARTLVVYWGRDWLAGTVVLAIAGALGLGLLELIARQLRIAHLERELRALPRTPDASTVDTAGPQLSGLLRARLDHQPLNVSSDGLAPFLTGLLVMLGLLGTLLGLFQTLHGAGHALTSSADLDALRSGLSAPIAGLTRSFGCAAAGISASAMLGLANALLRRRELRALRAVHAYALGPLRDHSASARQLRAIEVLASQGSALPAAANAIERVGEKLGEVSGKLIALQQSALEAQQRGMRELLADMHEQLAKTAADTGAALQAHMAPVLDRLAARSGEAIEQSSSLLGEVARHLGRELEQDAVRRRAEAAEALHVMRVRLDDAEAARAAAHASELATLTRLHANTLNESEQREQALAARWQGLIERLDSQLEAARTSERERLHSLDAQVAAARERDAEHANELASSSAHIHAELERFAATARERDAEHANELASSSAHIHAELERLAASARERDAEHASLLTDSSAQVHAELVRLANAQSTELERLSSAQTAELQRLSNAMSTELTQLSSSVNAELEQRMSSERRQAEHVERVLVQLSAAGAAVEHGIARQEGVLEQLIERVSPLFEQTAHSSREAAQLALERVDQSAQLLDGTVARQGTAIEGLVVRVSALLPELASAAQAGAITTLERLTALGEEQAARLTQLEATLTRERTEHVRGLAAELESHAAGIEQRLTRTSGAVEEAAGIWRASTVEMQAVAQLFATSVERQREAAEAWLESLNAVESAVEQAGRDAAGDALSDQLASTHELFARQLKFQHELLTQLRALRAGPGKTREARGGQDVPAGD